MRVEAAEVTKIRVHFIYFAGDQVETTLALGTQKTRVRVMELGNDSRQ